ncbi:TolC family protein [Dokdonella soli]|uniref:TolC family protein n=1 Tax=Dokdonella soli TaxID=529810 RepID=A0ABN1IBH7_9GAMM
MRKTHLAALAVLWLCGAHATDVVTGTNIRNALAAPPSTTANPYAGFGAPLDSWKVDASEPAEQSLSWPTFIHEVLEANLDYAAARYNVDMAAADAAAARLLPNPTLSLNGNRDLTFHDKIGIGNDGRPARLRQVESKTYGLDEVIETGGKRKWRTKVADQTLRAAAATLDDFLRNLKLDAASAYADTLAAQDNVDRLRIAAGFLADLSRAQEHRYSAGDIGKPDLTQTRLEELQFSNDLRKAEADAEQARFALSTFLGRNRGRTKFNVVGTLKLKPHSYDVDATISEMLKQRPDLVALRHARDAATSGVQLAKAARIPNVDLGLSYTHNGAVAINHPINPTPAFNALTLNVSVPIPLFDQGQYGVRKAFAASDQAETQLASAELKAEVGLRTADAQYRAALERVVKFQENVLKSADELLAAKRYSYQRGASTLLELLDAQRSANETRQAYESALADAAQALIELERASGIDQRIDFQ